MVALSSEDDKTIMITAASDPVEVYVSKDQKHVGFIKGAQFLLDKEPRQSLSESETDKCIQLHFGLLNLLSIMKSL